MTVGRTTTFTRVLGYDMSGLLGLMQPGPTLYEAEQQRKKKGSRGLLGEIGEPLSYAPGPMGLLGNAMLGAQYLTGEKSMDEGLSALSMLTAMMQGTKVAPIMRNAIKVYHGSPHKFDKADSSKIGTGEGAQAYGHGLYWAESPGVANQYKKSTSYADQVRQFRSELPDDADFDQVLELAKSGKLPENTSRVINELADNEWLGFDYPSQAISAAFKERKNFDMSPSLRKAIDDYGNLYEASLRWPDPAREAADPLSAKHFLDWDKPLKDQSADVLSALQKSRNKTIKSALERMNEPGTYSGEFVGGDSLVKLLSMNTTGRQISPQASLAIQKTGIPGITYLDAGSRAAGEGTRNYVTFDDALVELLKRNGVGLLGK